MSGMDLHARTWRAHLLHVVAPYDAPVLLSGGTDSGTILAALLAQGKRPHCYAYRVGPRDSPDAAAARRMCGEYGLRITVVEFPEDLGWLEQDVREVIALLRSARKAHVQCAQPIKALADAVRADGYTRAFVGTGGVIEDNRRHAIILGEEGEEACRAYRRKNLLETAGSATEQMHVMAGARGVRLIEPYSAQPLADYGLSLDVAQINSPRQKGLALRAFPEFWGDAARPRWWRKNSPLQVNSGLRELHDRLLGLPHLNPGGRFKAVVAIYNRMLEDETSDQLTLA